MRVLHSEPTKPMGTRHTVETPSGLVSVVEVVSPDTPTLRSFTVQPQHGSNPSDDDVLAVQCEIRNLFPRSES